MGQRDLAELRASLQTIVDGLLAETGASRATIRAILPELAADLTKPVVEARQPGIGSLLDKTRTDQDKSGTLNFLKRERRLLIQNDCRNPDPGAIPPQQLMDEYGTLAQMMGGLFSNDELVGFISVHENRRPREWNEGEISALERAVNPHDAGDKVTLMDAAPK